jgi:hypothetical protein
VSTTGHVDPFGNGNSSNDEIDYATVNVHQAQFAFKGYVGQLINQPIPPIALAGITDPIHINTFRFYLEEAGLSFGPCVALPAGWQAPGGGGFSFPDSNGDLFFDPNNYPFPDNFGATYGAGPYSLVSATCSEGLATDDPNLFSFNPPLPDGGTPLIPSQGGGPYGKVMDIIAPEFTAFRNLLTTDATGIGCGAPRYSQLWIPHWDATLQTGPTTIGDPLGATMLTTSLPTCPVAGPAGPSSVPAINGQCPWNPQLVQSIFDDTAVYVAHGGNLLAECIGAASLEDFQLGQVLQQFTLNPNPATGVAGTINQTKSHFMTEWDPLGSMTAYAPSFTYDLLGVTPPIGASTVFGASYVQNLANAALPGSCMDNPTTDVSQTWTYAAWTPPAKPATVYYPIGYPGNTVLPYDGVAGAPLAAVGNPPNGQALSYQLNSGGGTSPADAGSTLTSSWRAMPPQGGMPDIVPIA